MYEEIISLLSDDYYSLWEVKEVVSKKFPLYSQEEVSRSLLDLILKGQVVCVESVDLAISDIKRLSCPECVEAIRDDANWALPDAGTRKIIRVGLSG